MRCGANSGHVGGHSALKRQWDEAESVAQRKRAGFIAEG